MQNVLTGLHDIERQFIAGEPLPPEIGASVQVLCYGAVHGGSHLPLGRKHYEAAGRVLEHLDPNRGDVLFIEGSYGTGSTEPVSPIPSERRAEAEQDILARMQAGRYDSPFTYVRDLARAKGVPVFYVDMSPDYWDAVDGYLGNADRLSNREYLTVDREVRYGMRERASADIAASVARSRYREDAVHRPTYAILSGNAHVGDQGLPEALHDAGFEDVTATVGDNMSDMQMIGVVALGLRRRATRHMFGMINRVINRL